MRAHRSRHAEKGMAVVAVMVLIAVLFLTGTAMALTVSSNLHTVDVTSRQDAIHYAAESAVARGAAAAGQPGSCSLTGSINGQDFVASCPAPLHSVAPDPARLLSVPSNQLAAGDWQFPLQLPGEWSAVWTVIGWRTSDPLAAVRVWIGDAQDCDTQPLLPSASPVYVICRRSGEQQGNNNNQGQDQADTSAVLHISVRGGAVRIGGFVVRAGLRGPGTLVTVVGKSGIEVDEADFAMPDHVVTLWNTVLP